MTVDYKGDKGFEFNLVRLIQVLNIVKKKKKNCRSNRVLANLFHIEYLSYANACCSNISNGRLPDGFTN